MNSITSLNWKADPSVAPRGDAGVLSSSHQPANQIHPGEDINRRDQRHFTRADRHSSAVSILKRLLPVIAAVLTMTIIAAVILFQFQLPAEISVEGIGISGGKLVMQQPTMNGFDRKDRPFDVKADRAIQDLDNPGVVTLENIVAQLPINSTDFANVVAKTGLYDTKKEWLSLRDKIVVTAKGGLKINLDTAEIDLKGGTLKSDTPVTVISGSSSVRSDRLKITKNGETVIFENRVIMVITPAGSNGKNKQ